MIKGNPIDHPDRSDLFIRQLVAVNWPARCASTWLLRISRFLSVAALSRIPSDALERRWKELCREKMQPCSNE